jgi:hypothetical protein
LAGDHCDVAFFFVIAMIFLLFIPGVQILPGGAMILFAGATFGCAQQIVHAILSLARIYSMDAEFA